MPNFDDIASKAKGRGRDWVGWHEVAELLDHSVRTVQRWVEKGQLPSPAWKWRKARFSLDLLKEISDVGVGLPGTYPVTPNPYRQAMQELAAKSHPAKVTKVTKATRTARPKPAATNRKRGAK